MSEIISSSTEPISSNEIDLNSYTGKQWGGNADSESASDNGVPDTCFLRIESVFEQQVTFGIDIVRYATPDGLSEPLYAEIYNCTGTLEGSTVEFSFIDNYDNKGNGTLEFNDATIDLNTIITEANPEAEFNAGITVTLTEVTEGF